MTLGNALRAIGRRWYVLVILILGARLFFVEKMTKEIVPGEERTVVVGPDSTVVRTEPVVVRRPNLVEKVLRTDAVDRYREAFEVPLKGTSLGRAVEAEAVQAYEITMIRAESPGDSAFFRWGEALDHPAFDLGPVSPTEYRIVLRPRRYSVGVVEGRDGEVLASLRDETIGRDVPIESFTVRRQPESWRRRWLSWDAGVGVSSGVGDDRGPATLYARFGVSPVSWTKGAKRVDLFRVDVDPHRVAVEVVRISR